MTTSIRTQIVAAILAIALTTSLFGCYSSADIPTAQQEDFILKLRRLSSEMDRVKSERSGQDGKLPPRDLEDRIAKKEQEVDDAMHHSTPVAVNWNANIDELERSGGLIVVRTSYKEQRYVLRVFHEQAMKVAETFAVGDKIVFSGNLGPERSVTRYGAFLNPEFALYPTSIRKGAIELTQPSEVVEKLILAQKKSAEEARLKEQIQENCKAAVVRNLRYPASAHFSWFQSDIRKLSESRWEYRGVIEATNALGGRVPSRFGCTVNISGEDLRITVKILD